MVESLQGVPVIAIAAGGWHTLVLGATRDVYSCGRDHGGQLGRVVSSEEPASIFSLVRCVIDGSCRPGGHAGDGSSERVDMDDLTSIESRDRQHESTEGVCFAAVAAGAAHSAALDSCGVLYTWGSNEFGQLGTDTRDGPLRTPTPVRAGDTFESVYGGHSSNRTVVVSNTNRPMVTGSTTTVAHAVRGITPDVTAAPVVDAPNWSGIVDQSSLGGTRAAAVETTSRIAHRGSGGGVFS